MKRRKSDLPEKICPVCGLPFAWRKKWERVWDEVVFCSERCRRRKRSVRQDSDKQDPAKIRDSD